VKFKLQSVSANYQQSIKIQLPNVRESDYVIGVNFDIYEVEQTISRFIVLTSQHYHWYAATDWPSWMGS